MFRICKNSLSACPCRHFSSRPQPPLHTPHAASTRVVTPATLAGATRGKKAAKGASTSPAHFIPRDITGNAWRSRSALSCAKCAPSNPWLVLSLPDAGTSSSRLQREAALPERRGHPGPPSVAAPSWHACAVVRTVRGQSDMSTAERRLTRTPRWTAVRG